MANLQNFKDLRDAFNSETDRLSAKVVALGARVEELLARDAGSLSAAEEQEIHDEFAAISARLKTIGADPNDPVPPVA